MQRRKVTPGTSPGAGLLPAALIAAGVGLILWALAGCAARQEQGYTPRDEVRAACATAARAYGVAIERTRAGEMSRETFRAIDDGYAGVVETCRRVLADGQPARAGDVAEVAVWTASVPVDREMLP
jgi:hypothetical protein